MNRHKFIFSLLILSFSLIFFTYSAPQTAKAATWYAGTPNQMHGTWYTKYHKFKHPTTNHYYYRIQYTTRYQGQSHLIDLIYSKKKKLKTNSAGYGIVFSLIHTKVAANTYLLGGYSNGESVTYQVASFSGKRKMILRYPTNTKMTHFKSFGTFYKK